MTQNQRAHPHHLYRNAFIRVLPNATIELQDCALLRSRRRRGLMQDASHTSSYWLQLH